MYWGKGTNVTEKWEMVSTGKIRAVLSHIDFRYYLEELWSDNSWKPLGELSFVDIKQAKEYFERAKQARKSEPVDIGNWHD